MTDLVERLRGPAPHMIGPLMAEAADEIERLTAQGDVLFASIKSNVDEVERLREELDRLQRVYDQIREVYMNTVAR